MSVALPAPYFPLKGQERPRRKCTLQRKSYWREISSRVKLFFKILHIMSVWFFTLFLHTWKDSEQLTRALTNWQADKHPCLQPCRQRLVQNLEEEEEASFEKKFILYPRLLVWAWDIKQTCLQTTQLQKGSLSMYTTQISLPNYMYYYFIPLNIGGILLV